jgi:transcriptional regulator with AAA-type ATPase domain
MDLSYLLGTKHGVGNCIVMNHLEEYYPAGVKEFKHMVERIILLSQPVSVKDLPMNSSIP